MHLVDSAEYVVSELVTNAIETSQYTWQATVTVWLASDARELLIEVWDGSTEPPMPAAELLGEGGRGLVIVEALCHSWGFYPNCRSGKVVWALL